MTVPVPAPDNPKKPYKAYAATALAGLSVFVAAWATDTDPFTSKEIVAALVAAVIGSGITGGATYAVANPTKRDTGWKHGEAGEAYIGLIVGVLLVLILVVVLLRLL